MKLNTVASLIFISLLAAAACDDADPEEVVAEITNSMYCGASTWGVSIMGASNPNMYVAQDDCFLIEVRDAEDNVIELTEDFRTSVTVHFYAPLYDEDGNRVGECLIEGVDEDSGSLNVRLDEGSGYCAWEPDGPDEDLVNRRWIITGGTLSSYGGVWSLRAEADVAIYFFEGSDTANPFGTLELGTGTINYDGEARQANIAWPEASEVEASCPANGCYEVAFSGQVADGGIDVTACEADLESLGQTQELNYTIVRDGALADMQETVFEFTRVYDTCRFIARDGANWLHVLDYDDGVSSITYQSIAGGRVCELLYTGDLVEVPCD